MPGLKVQSEIGRAVPVDSLQYRNRGWARSQPKISGPKVKLKLGNQKRAFGSLCRSTLTIRPSSRSQPGPLPLCFLFEHRLSRERPKSPTGWLAPTTSFPKSNRKLAIRHQVLSTSPSYLTSDDAPFSCHCDGCTDTKFSHRP